MVCLFFAISSKAANKVLILKDTEFKKVGIIQSIKESNMEAKTSNELLKAPLLWWCVIMGTKISGSSRGIDGSTSYTITYTLSCVYYTFK